MTNLTIQEQNFYDGLTQDYFDNKNLSLISVFFFGGNIKLDASKEIIKALFQDNYKNFFNDSIFLFNSERSSIIGKYKSYFWYINEDAYISFIDTEFSNFLYFMTDEHTFSIIDKKLYEDFEDTLSRRKINLNDYILKYKILCENNGYIFDMKWEYDENKAEEFDKIIRNLK